MSAATITALGTFTLTGPFVTPVTGTVTYDVPSRTATFTPTGNLLNNTTYSATIATTAKNPVGTALARPFVWSFSTAAFPDITAPQVSFTAPANGDTSVAVNRKIVATFNEAMDPATIIAANVTVTGPTGTISGGVTYAAASFAMTFTPLSNLATSATYTVTIKGPAGVTDVAVPGNFMAANYTWSFTTAGLDTTAPRISSTDPIDLAVNVPTNKKISATFTEAMDPLTIITANFTLMEGLTPVTGTVAYDVLNNFATFTPLSLLTPSTTYTARVTNGATDLAGNPLVAGLVPNPWTFTTAALPGPVVSLLTATPYGTFGGSAGMTNTGIQTVINGDIGSIATGATAITGFHDSTGNIYTETPANIGNVTGTINTCTNSTTGSDSAGPNAAKCAIATQARLDAQAAYLALVALPTGGASPQPVTGNLAGLTLLPGVYTAAPSFMIQGGDLTLDPAGDANAFWVFQMATTLLVGGPGATAPQSVILIPPAQAKNVFWQVGSAATINAAGGGTMVGTIISQDGAVFSTVGNTTIVTLNGRALSLGASVTLVDTVINVPAP
jgi:hypothetical protein